MRAAPACDDIDPELLKKGHEICYGAVARSSVLLLNDTLESASQK
jgi:hypothetical protein